MVPVLVLIVAACAGDSATEPTGVGTTQWRDRDTVQVSVSPNTLTIETNQVARFSGRVHSSAADSIDTAIEWSATGGTITSDGLFSSTQAGTFRIVGRGRQKTDTATVTVVTAQPTLASLAVSPASVSLAAGASQQFSVVAKLSDSTTATVGTVWTATGGTVDANGMYTAGSTAGTYKVVVANTAGTIADTALVTVTAPAPAPAADTTTTTAVAPSPTLSQVILAPTSVSMLTGATKQMAVYGRMSNGDSVAVPVTYSATGGTVSSAGLYTAGSTAGTYRVIAKASSGLADTSVVTLTAPTLSQVVMTPASASILTGATQQFAVYGRMSNGDSVAVAVTYTATGGTITSGGLFTAGSTTGSYRVIAKAASGPADTAAVTLSAPVASTSTKVGLPYGPVALVSAGVSGTPFSLSFDSYSASTIVSRIDAARSKGMRLVLALTGGSHSNYLTNGVFDRSKWEAKMQTFNTSTIRTAIANGVADGTIIGASVMDEPQVSGSGDGNTWGPAGTMTKVRVDSLCTYAKALFPTLPVGVAHRYNAFEPNNSYRVCEFIISSYSERVGNVTTYRDGALAMAARDHIAMLFSINVLNGGTQDTDGVWDCAGTGGIGTYAPNCRMTPQQIRDFSSVLGPAGCGLLMWQYDQTYMTNATNLLAFNDVAKLMATAPARSCRRS